MSSTSHSPALRYPRPLPSLPNEDITVYPFLASPVRSYARDPKTAKSPSPRNQIKAMILPNREDTFWPLQGEALGGSRAAVSSSIFRHPKYHAHRSNTADDLSLAKDLSLLAHDNPLADLCPPGHSVANANLAIVARPLRSFLPFLTPVNILFIQRGKERKGKRKATGEEDEEVEMFSSEKIRRASNRYAARQAGRSIGVRGASGHGPGFWGEKRKFEMRGRELGLLAR